MQAIPPISTPQQKPVLQASKWTALQVLLAPEEFNSLLEHLTQPSLYLCGSLWQKDEFANHSVLFSQAYNDYIVALSQGEQPDLAKCRTFFSACLSTDDDSVYLQDVQKGEFLLRPNHPLIQIQHHTMSYSPYDNKMHSMVFGKEAITWGVQLSYPQMYIESGTGRVCQTTEEDNPPNYSLFKTLQRWIRHNTLPTSFQTGEHTVRSSLRLGKECLPWINNHCQLKAQNIQVI
ncbi:MAG: hypothetical protein WC222_04285 [Parachlamydiales bacterium]|jgi:hypothetical protein